MLIAAVPLYALILLAHGLIPGMVNDGPTSYLLQGAIRCTNDLGVEALGSWCHAYGEPLGYPLLTAGPFIGLGALLVEIPGLGSYGAYLTAGALILALALAGGYALMRRLGAGPLVAIGTAAAYLLSPTVLGLIPFGGVGYGYALLPAMAAADLYVMDAIERRRGRPLGWILVAYALLKTTAIFMDGYSFIAGNLVSAALWAAWLIRRDLSRRRRLIGVGALAGANAIAAAAYLTYVPDLFETNPLGVFRSLGVDLTTLVVPTESVWFAAILGIDADHTDLWGDGTNSAFNYLGLACLGLALAYLVRSPRRRAAVALGVAGLVALMLSLGPSLKVNDTRPLESGLPSAESYLMPESAATASLPWGGVYTAVPGVESMRATYRWIGVSRLALVVLAGLMVARLTRASGRRRWIGLSLAGLAAVELLPNLPLSAGNDREAYRDLTAVAGTAASDLRSLTVAGERTFLLGDASHNDFIVNYLAPFAGLRAYNAGGDKNVAMARQRWPAEVSTLAQASVGPDAVHAALRSGRVDVVIAPYFDLRLSAYAWPPAPDARARARSGFAPLLSDPRLAVRDSPWLATIRLRDDGAPAP